MKSTQQTIHLLQEHIIDQIKAGEVIERPSTLLKEIIENSIDAGSKNIHIEIQENGLDLISIEDDGHGINPSELPLAFCRHATSKISRFEDLYSLGSYGFRGEALASIASISRVSCDTKTANSQGQFKIEGGETLLHETSETQTGKTGTKLFIKDLFYNTPARMKFIQSATTEKNKLKKILNAFLLTNPQIGFTIKWDMGDKDFYSSVTESDFEKRITETLFPNKKTSFFHNENSYDGLRVKLYLTKASSRGNAHKKNFIFVNDRFIQDIQLHKIILNSAQNLWTEGESGSYIVKIDIPSDEIDVNVHPNKTIIKFYKPGKVFSLVSSTIKQIETEQSLERASTLPQETQNKLFEDADSPRDFNYREFNFSNESQTQAYFDELHGTNTTEYSKVFEILKRFSKFCLTKFNNDLFIVSLPNLVRADLAKIIENLDPTDVIPLLVSRPIEIKDNFDQKSIDYLMDLGFECDHLKGGKSILLRSFPKAVQNYPYITMVDNYLHTKNLDLKKITEYDFQEIGFDHISDIYIAELILKMSPTDLRSLGILQHINEKDISYIYERK